MITDNREVEILRSELGRRCAENPGYSLRAFARALEISPSLLSMVISGKAPVSRKLSHKVKQQFGSQLAQSVLKTQTLSLDQFALLSDWYHLAIICLTDIPEFKSDPAWIAKKLKISPIQAKLAFERLIRMGILKKQNNKWVQPAGQIRMDNKISTEATRKFQRQCLEKALWSLENDPVEARDFSSMTLAIDPALVPLAREKIQAFRRQLTKELEAFGKAKSVYHLTVQIYPVSETETKAIPTKKRKLNEIL